MAHHQKHQYERRLGGPESVPLETRPVAQVQSTDEEEIADVDEPPDNHISFGRLPMHAERSTDIAGSRSRPSQMNCRKHSLLTEAILTSPNLRSVPGPDTLMSRAHSTTSNHSAFSFASTADLTSDGGMTSPARSSTPSPPLPSTMATGLPLIPPKGFEGLDASHPGEVVRLPPPLPVAGVETTPKAEQEPQKRRITFACSRPTPTRAESDTMPKKQEPEPTKRPCMLRFACPSRPSREPEVKAPQPAKAPKSSPVADAMAAAARSGRRQHRDSQSTIKDEPLERTEPKYSASLPKKCRSEALRFHEFASARMEEDEWITAKPADRQKITVSDTLRKENAIRKLGEEAEEEALEEEDAADEAELDDESDGLNDDDEDAMNSGEDDEEEEEEEEEDESDDGNETDDEEGFAASDDESEAGSQYDFWTLAATTVTATAHSPRLVDSIRTRRHRATSESSIESTINTAAVPMERANRPPKLPKARRRRGEGRRMRPATPELPDSTDFVCGTLDEDRPLEDAYKSCMEQRRIAKHGVIPQDVDPSFPTSDPEQDEDEDEEDETHAGSDSQAWVAGKPDESDEGRQAHHGRGRSDTGRGKMGRSPAPSPKRLRSPAPAASKRAFAARSPPPRRLFGHHSPRRAVSPAGHRNLPSPPSSRRASFVGAEAGGIAFPHLAQRPNLTHTKSLPRTPNPFWLEHRRQRWNTMDRMRIAEGNDEEADQPLGLHGDAHRRGPIDIVQGLERKRQRRKEKFWRQHCRQHAGKEKERVTRPGKGAERMRELGLEMADRCKGYGQRMQLVLSL